MWQRHHHRAGAEAAADAILQRARPQEALDGELSDRDHDSRPQHFQLGVEPGRAVQDRLAGRTPVAPPVLGAPGEAADDRAEIDLEPELLRGLESGAQHPARQLLT